MGCLASLDGVPMLGVSSLCDFTPELRGHSSAAIPVEDRLVTCWEYSLLQLPVGIQTTRPVCCSVEHPPINAGVLGLRLEFQTNVPEDPWLRVCMYHEPVKPSARIGVMHFLFLGWQTLGFQVSHSPGKVSLGPGMTNLRQACSHVLVFVFREPGIGNPQFCHPQIWPKLDKKVAQKFGQKVAAKVAAKICQNYFLLCIVFL